MPDSANPSNSSLRDRVCQVIDRIRRREEVEHHLHVLESLCTTMTKGSLCAMGGLTPMPVQSALRHFPHDFGLEGGAS